MRRSSRQNKYYWGVIIPAVVEFYNSDNKAKIMDDLRVYGADDDMLAGMIFRPQRHITFSEEFIHEHLKMLFNNGDSTGDLDTYDAERFYLSIRAHFGVYYGLDIPPPNEPPIDQLIH